jgi:hypothetical protein
MTGPFEPELGQALFSNSQPGMLKTDSYVTAGLDLLGAMICDGDYTQDPTCNTGAYFENDVFALRAYCWCDGTAPGHHGSCPPNFVCGDFHVSWYKHAGRGASQNRPVTTTEWAAIIGRCVNSLTGSSAT